SGVVHLLSPDLAVLKSKRQDMAHHQLRLQAFHKDLFYETLAWKAGNGPPVLLDGDDKKLPKNACLRLVVPDIIRIALAKLPVVEVVEERPVKRRAVEPAPSKPQAPATKDFWGSTTAPSTEPELAEQPLARPLEPKDLKPLDPNEPAVSRDRAQDLLLSGKEVWAATVSLRTVLLQYVRAAVWGPIKQPDIVAKLINPQDADVVALWSQNRGLPKILVEKEEIYVSAQFLQAHCKKLTLEGSPRSQRERSRSPRRCKHAAEEEQAEAAQPAEDVEMPDTKPAEEAEDKPAEDADAKPAVEAEDKPICREWLDLYLDDKAIYDDARLRVESGFLDGWILDCEMILDKEVTPLKELPKFGCLKERARTHPLSDQGRAQVKRILSSGGEVWGASQDSERTVLFQKVLNGLSIGQLAPDFFAKLINPKRDGELVDAWCETVGRQPRMMAYGKRGEFMLTTEFVQAYCWELSLDNVDGQHHAEQAEPAADAKPAEAEDEAEPAPVADAKPAVAEDKPAEQADDNAEPAAAEDAKPAEEGDDKPAEQAEDEAEPPFPEEAEDDQPAA
ncbi:arcC, partial [Symbiodinium sp. KB8]